MKTSPARCYRALLAHDPRFDGVFYVGVRTTGIYCRPVCPARAPKRAHCEFFPSAAAAEREGYRPCLRCRPELAPGNASVDAPRRLAAAAAGRIGTVEGGLECLARELGVTARHVRRVVMKRFGVTPVELLQTRRLLEAKRLLTDTAMPVTQVAYASGFGSLRRFNALFRSRYRLRPTDLRRRKRGGAMTRYTTVASPIGPLVLCSNGKALTGLHMHPATIGDDWKRDDRAAPFAVAREQLAEYFAGERTTFDVPLEPEGTAFQLRVWEELRAIPYGETRSYADIARQVGSPRGFRAVGLANGRNPIAVIVPCHRVIGADGSLTGFGGGLDRKRTLLDLESKTRLLLR